MDQPLPMDQVFEFVKAHAPEYILVKDRRSRPNVEARRKLASTPITIKVAKIQDVVDQTVYVERSKVTDGFTSEAAAQLEADLQNECAVEEEITLTDGVYKCKGRALICLCGKGQWVSITLRRSGKLTGGDGKGISDANGGANRLVADLPLHTGYEDKGFTEKDAAKYFNPAYELYKRLHELIFEGTRNPQGLVIVAGSTGTGKSTAARGIIDEYLYSRITATEVDRRPHLITYEDPIEKRAFDDGVDVIDGVNVPVPFWEVAQRNGIDYTPRQKRLDVKSLAEAFADAKRQTPYIFYIGEVRHDREWKEIVNFAGAGNLVVATTHANSVVECMKKVFRALEVKTSADRGQIASRFLGIAHLRPHVVTGEYIRNNETIKFAWKATLPALWRKTPQGVKGLVSDGLSSVLPYYLSENDISCNTIGRRTFARGFIEHIKDHHQDADWASKDAQGRSLLDRITENLIKAAIRFDLEEM